MQQDRLTKISTGSMAIDSLLGGGVSRGMVTDIYGESGAGKSQFCFNLCANCTKQGGTAIFVDTAGTFRPERIVEISGSRSVLEKISFLRALNTLDQQNAVRKILDTCPHLVIVDTLTSLFSAEYSGPARHLAVMKHLHNLALSAINVGCAVAVTNMIRNSPTTIVDQEVRNTSQALVPFQHREFLGSSVSLYSHMKVKLEITDSTRSLFTARLVEPAGKNPVAFVISSRGISDIN